MHINSALRGVPEEDRCAGWRTGQCEEIEEEEAERVKSSCPACALPLEAEDEETIARMLAAHRKASPDCVPQPHPANKA